MQVANKVRLAEQSGCDSKLPNLAADGGDITKRKVAKYSQSTIGRFKNWLSVTEVLVQRRKSSGLNSLSHIR